MVMKNPVKPVTRILMAVFCLSIVLPAEAALISRLGGAAAYDDVLDITWTTSANINGPDSWADQVAWADGFSLGGFDDWRLASVDVNGDSTVVNCNGASELDCRDNELGYMFYQNMGGSFGSDLTGNQTVGTGLDAVTLTNVQSIYWSGTEFAPSPSRARRFFFNFGYPSVDFKSVNNYAWAVRSGDVAAVPEPGTMLLMSAGLFGLLGFGRSKRRI
jgi:hypothetical protein